jgi:hypothetical protein
LKRRYLDDVPVDVPDELVERAVGWVALRMRQARVPPWLVRRQESPEQTVMGLRARGLSAGAIARRTGVPKARVRAMLRSVPSGASANVRAACTAALRRGCDPAG